MNIYIYQLADPRTKEVKYVGKTNKPAVRLKNHRSIRCNRSIRPWRDELFSLGLHPVMTVLEVVDDGRWHEREQFWIKCLREVGNDLLNIATWPSPGPVFYRQVAQSTRDKLRRAFKGRPISPEQRAQISKTLTGKKQSPETVAKRRATINANRIAKGLEPWVSGDASKERKRDYAKRHKQEVRLREGKPARFSPEWRAKIAKGMRRFRTNAPEEYKEKQRQCGRETCLARKGQPHGPMSTKQKHSIAKSLQSYLASLSPQQRKTRMVAARAANPRGWPVWKPPTFEVVAA